MLAMLGPGTAKLLAAFLTVSMMGVIIIFPMWMLVNCIFAPDDQFHSKATRAKWALAILLTGAIGAAIYFFAIYRGRPKRVRATVQELGEVLSRNVILQLAEIRETIFQSLESPLAAQRAQTQDCFEELFCLAAYMTGLVAINNFGERSQSVYDAFQGRLWQSIIESGCPEGDLRRLQDRAKQRFPEYTSIMSSSPFEEAIRSLSHVAVERISGTTDAFAYLRCVAHLASFFGGFNGIGDKYKII
jgi:hypothetical protein